MADAPIIFAWPSRKDAAVIGKSHNRVDGIAKSTGAAKYTYDVNLDRQLIAIGLGCPHAHCRIKGIDVKAAQQTPGVVHVEILPHALSTKDKDGVEKQAEVQWQGEILVVVAAESEGAAREGVSKVKIDYELLDVFADDANLEAAKKAGRAKDAGGKEATEKEPGDNEDEKLWVEKELGRLFKDAAVVVDGFYGIDSITHCCLEPHGSTASWNGDKLTVYLSTQNVSGTDDQLAKDLGITADDVDVRCEYIGGGFGCKFAPDYWGLAAAKISKTTGRPVKFMLDRDQELKLGGNRPSGYVKVKAGADKSGKIIAWDSHHWGSGGAQGGGVAHGTIPYVLIPKNYRRKQTAIAINAAPARAWRAPNHPQACAMTQTVIDDVAAKLGLNSLDVFLANLPNAANNKSAVYADQLKVAAGLMDWNAKWHLHGKGQARGSVVDGLGIGLHTWGGAANNSSCILKIHPDGAVETFCGTQDLGSGTRTVCAMVVAETFGLTPKDVKLNIGSSKLPNSGPSGGSTTIGGVCESHRRASLMAVAQLFDAVAPKLGAKADELEAAGGRIRVKANGKSLSWKEACSVLGLKPLEVSASYKSGEQSPLSSSQVAGVQMAHVEVDRETGVVKMKKFVAVQDQGLVINPKTCKSQIYGAVIMGIAYSLFEERLLDPKSGALLNCEMADYKLARLGDVGDIVVELYEPDSERQRGVIGNGEPPVIAPGAAIANAVANALGVRVPVLPITPKRVLDALAGRA